MSDEDQKSSQMSYEVSNVSVSEKIYPVIYKLYMKKPQLAGIILCMHPANQRQCYIVTSSLIGWAHTQNDFRACITGFPITLYIFLKIIELAHLGKPSCIISIV